MAASFVVSEEDAVIGRMSPEIKKLFGEGKAAEAPKWHKQAPKLLVKSRAINPEDRAVKGLINSYAKKLKDMEDTAVNFNTSMCIGAASIRHRHRGA